MLLNKESGNTMKDSSIKKSEGMDLKYEQIKHSFTQIVHYMKITFVKAQTDMCSIEERNSDMELICSDTTKKVAIFSI